MDDPKVGSGRLGASVPKREPRFNTRHKVSCKSQPGGTVVKTKIWFLSSALLLAAFAAYAQQATVKRNVILRGDSTTASVALEHLRMGASLTLLDSASRNGFYHVKAKDGQSGWVWARNIGVQGPSSEAPQQPLPGTTASRVEGAQCDNHLWKHVYIPQRLIVKQPCIAVTGTIVDASHGKEPDGVRHEADGDTHGWLDLDPQFKSLLNAGNMGHQEGNLVFEIVCEFHVTQADAKPACPATYHNTVQLPPAGSRVRIVGSYVQDTNHGRWMEIHPVTAIELAPSSP